MSRKCQSLCLGLLLLTTAGWTQQLGRVLGNGQELALRQTVGEVLLLQRLVGLQLSDAQIEQIIAAHVADLQAPDQTPDQQLMARLQSIRQRLLAGTLPVSADLTVLRDAAQQATKRNPAPAKSVTELTPLAHTVWDILTPAQQDALLSGTPLVANAPANPAKGSRTGPLLLLKRLDQLRPIEDALWLPERDRLAAGLAETAGAPASPQRKNAAGMLVDFFNRVHKMSDADFAGKQEGLIADLGALLPTGANVYLVIYSGQPQMIQSLLDGTLLHFWTPRLLSDILQARRTGCATCKP